MSIVAKVLGRVLIKRIVAGTDAELRGEQAGFRKGRNTTEQIFVLRNIIEQVAEWNSSLYLCFVDYGKAFERTQRHSLEDHEVLWNTHKDRENGASHVH